MTNLIGQKHPRHIIDIHTRAYLERGYRMPPFLIKGPSGSGKTFLAKHIVEAAGAAQIYLDSNAVDTPLEIYHKVQKAKQEPNRLFFLILDEFHLLRKKVKNALLTVFEEPYVITVPWPKDEVIKAPDGLRNIKRGEKIKLRVPTNISFILITTDVGDVPESIRTRCQIIPIDTYSSDEKVEIAKQYVGDIDIAKKIGTLARNIRHLKELAEMAEKIRILNPDMETNNIWNNLLELNKLDADGLNEEDREYLDFVFHNGPVALNTCAGYLNKPTKTVQEVIEPYLISRGFVKITGRGRKLTMAGINALFNNEVNSNYDIDFDDE